MDRMDISACVAIEELMTQYLIRMDWDGDYNEFHPVINEDFFFNVYLPLMEEMRDYEENLVY